MPQLILWYCGHCGMGPLGQALDDHCCYCGRKRDACAKFEGFVKVTEPAGELISFQDSQENGHEKPLGSVTLGDEEREGECVEDNSSLASSYEGTSTMQTSTMQTSTMQTSTMQTSTMQTSLVCDRDNRDKAVKEQTELNQDSVLTSTKNVSQGLERLNTSSTSDLATFEQSTGQYPTDLASLKTVNFDKVLEPDVNYQKSGKDTSITTPSKIDQYLTNLENQDIVVFPYPGESSFRLPSSRARQPYVPERRQEVADNRKNKRCCDECKRRKVACRGRETGRDCEECTEKNRLCRRSDEKRMDSRSQQSSHQADDKVVAQEEDWVSSFDAVIDATMNEQDLAMPEVESQTVISQYANLRDVQDTGLPLAPTEFEPTEFSTLGDFLDAETDTMLTPYSRRPGLHVPDVLQNIEPIVNTNIEALHKYYSHSFPITNEEYMTQNYTNVPQQGLNYDQSEMFDVPLQNTQYSAMPDSFLNSSSYEISAMRNLGDAVSDIPQQFQGIRNAADFYDYQYDDDDMHDLPEWYTRPITQGHSQTAITSPFGMHGLPSGTPGFTPSSDNTAVLESDAVTTPPIHERLNRDKGKGKETLHSGHHGFEDFMFLGE